MAILQDEIEQRQPNADEKSLNNGTIFMKCYLVEKTIEYLSKDQNDDGGFAPWKNHPIGSDPWSTGVVLWGLSKWGDRVDKQIFKKALMWLRKSQLPCGVWPYHYLDDGTSMAVLGIVGAQIVLEGTI